MTDEDTFHRMLDGDPTQSETRLIFADWLEEQGDERAAGMRWLGLQEKWPALYDRNYTRDENQGLQKAPDDWCWFHPDNPGGDAPSMRNAVIPSHIFALLDTSRGAGGLHSWKSELARREAEDALCRAYWKWITRKDGK